MNSETRDLSTIAVRSGRVSRYHNTEGSGGGHVQRDEVKALNDSLKDSYQSGRTRAHRLILFRQLALYRFPIFGPGDRLGFVAACSSEQRALEINHTCGLQPHPLFSLYDPCGNHIDLQC